MFRKGLVYIILVSMMLHCASRMNLLSYVFEHRQELALMLGIIDEIPISTCHHAYEFDKGLNIQMSDDEKSNLPPVLAQATEIILFFQHSVFHLDPESVMLMAQHFTMMPEKQYAPPKFPIFHPPS